MSSPEPRRRNVSPPERRYVVIPFLSTRRRCLGSIALAVVAAVYRGRCGLSRSLRFIAFAVVGHVRCGPTRSLWSRSLWSRSLWSRSLWSRSLWSRSLWSRSLWSRSCDGAGPSLAVVSLWSCWCDGAGPFLVVRSDLDSWLASATSASSPCWLSSCQCHHVIHLISWPLGRSCLVVGFAFAVAGRARCGRSRSL